MITAKKLKINYLGGSYGESEQGVQYCWEFANGLIMFHSDSSANWFFLDRDSIQLCGLDTLESIEEGGELASYSAQELASIWGESVGAYDDSTGIDLVKQLIKNV